SSSRSINAARVPASLVDTNRDFSLAVIGCVPLMRLASGPDWFCLPTTRSKVFCDVRRNSTKPTPPGLQTMSSATPSSESVGIDGWRPSIAVLHAFMRHVADTYSAPGDTDARAKHGVTSSFLAAQPLSRSNRYASNGRPPTVTIAFPSRSTANPPMSWLRGATIVTGCAPGVAYSTSSSSVGFAWLEASHRPSGLNTMRLFATLFDSCRSDDTGAPVVASSRSTAVLRPTAITFESGLNATEAAGSAAFAVSAVDVVSLGHSLDGCRSVTSQTEIALAPARTTSREPSALSATTRGFPPTSLGLRSAYGHAYRDASMSADRASAVSAYCMPLSPRAIASSGSSFIVVWA